MKKWVYSFGSEKTEGNASMRSKLGGKGANLAEMSTLKLPVPPGFTITTDVCAYYYNNEKLYPKDLKNQVNTAIKNISKQIGREFNSPKHPLLVSVRSGAQESMPGMMDTVLNLGLNDKTVQIIAEETNDSRFAYDSYRRFIQMYSNVVLKINSWLFEEIIENTKVTTGKELDTEISAEEWQKIIVLFKQIVNQEAGKKFPQDPHEQMWGAINAVFASWMGKRAVTYRTLNNIPQDSGTAVNIQAMVFGNMGEKSATGVAFTRNPSTGENKLYGEFLPNSQGEDVVAGIRTPQPLTEFDKVTGNSDQTSLEKLMPEIFTDFCNVAILLEKHFRDMQDIEFTIERGKLWILQTRSGMRTAEAELRIAVEMENEKLITRKEAVLRIDPASLEVFLHPVIDLSSDNKAKKECLLTKGLPASPGAATGQIVFSPDDAEEMHRSGIPVILVRLETSPEDINGMYAAKGILTARGGMTSHAAVVARGMAKPCVSGAIDIKINYKEEKLLVSNKTFSKGDTITIDGSSGKIYQGIIPTRQPKLSDHFSKIMEWSDEISRMSIRANAETPEDAKVAYSFGAKGIGLCRTEHMFFDADRINTVREMILAETKTMQKAAIDKLLPIQRSDFVKLFKVMSGLPVTIRLLDPPLHEFLPEKLQEIDNISKEMSMDQEKLRQRIDALREYNPMLGHRGCRLAISYPELVEMQARAIFEAVTTIINETKTNSITPEIMVPLVAIGSEFDYIKNLIDKVAAAVQEESGNQFNYIVGTMIELPRAALTADKIAENADFFSFGTNDLTQTTFGISRDDSAGFLATYNAKNIINKDPFISIDVESVGILMKIAINKGKQIKPDLKVGICGEHGGDPESIKFCEKIGLDYVSCSPFRIPVARLAAAQATILADINYTS